MSYPWWLFKLTLKNADTMERKDVDWQVTDLEPEACMAEIVADFTTWADKPDRPEEVQQWLDEGWRLVGILYIHCLTFGVEPESDGILTGLKTEQVENFLGYESQGGYGE